MYFITAKRRIRMWLLQAWLNVNHPHLAGYFINETLMLSSDRRLWHLFFVQYLPSNLLCPVNLKLADRPLVWIRKAFSNSIVENQSITPCDEKERNDRHVTIDHDALLSSKKARYGACFMHISFLLFIALCVRVGWLGKNEEREKNDVSRCDRWSYIMHCRRPHRQ